MTESSGKLVKRYQRNIVALFSCVLGLAASLAPLALPAQPFPAELELADLLAANGGDGSAGFVINGIESGDEAGFSVASIGDVNGDGIGDLIVGAHRASPAGRKRAGEAYVVYGRASGFGAEFELSTLLAANGGDGSAGFVLRGAKPFDAVGGSASSAGDVNNDGIDDIIVGAWGAGPAGRTLAGESYVVFGSASPMPAEFDLAGLSTANGGDGSTGFVIRGIDSDDRSGVAVSGGGDVNGDGIDDVLVGAHRADPDGRANAGEAYVVFGSGAGFAAEFELASLHAENGGDGTSGFVVGGGDEALAGYSLAAGGDVNADGIDDILIGAYSASRSGRAHAGESYIVFGRATGFPASLDLASLTVAGGGDGSGGVAIVGANAGDYSGYSVGALGDVNADGTGDLVIGAYRGDPGGRNYAGASYVVYGNASGYPAELDLAALPAAGGGDGSAGFAVYGIGANDRSGIAVDSAGDLNSDGIGDLYVGAQRADPGGRINAGQGYVVFGTAAGHGPELELSDLLAAAGGDGSVGLALNGDGNGSRAAHAGASAGDINGDSIDDLIMGAPRATAGGRRRAGHAYVVYGRLADLDGDGIADSVDNCPAHANPSQADLDADTVGDACDNCTEMPNADQCDTNADGYGNACDGDLNNNGIVNSFDLTLLRDSFGSAGGDADLDCNGVVNTFDLSALRELFGKPPGPSALVP